MSVKKIVLPILIIAVVGAFIAYKMYNKPHVDVTEARSDVVLTANQIISDFSTNEANANTKYLEKIIEVSGTISKLNVEKNKGIVTLKTNDDFGNVLCHLSEASTPKINVLKEGLTVTIKGICTGYLMDVILVKCEITN